MSDIDNQPNESRRQFVKTTAYVAPLVLTLSAAPSLAQAGSGYIGDCGSESCGEPQVQSTQPPAMKFKHLRAKWPS